MQTQELELVKKVKQDIRLVEGEFTPSEAMHIIRTLLNEKINFHKLQRLTVLEGDCNSQTSYADNRIQELENEKEIAKEFISKMRKEGIKLRINSTIEITAAID
jgi:hypothetical protein